MPVASWRVGQLNSCAVQRHPAACISLTLLHPPAPPPPCLQAPTPCWAWRAATLTAPPCWPAWCRPTPSCCASWQSWACPRCRLAAGSPGAAQGQLAGGGRRGRCAAARNRVLTQEGEAWWGCFSCPAPHRAPPPHALPHACMRPPLSAQQMVCGRQEGASFRGGRLFDSTHTFAQLARARAALLLLHGSAWGESSAAGAGGVWSGTRGLGSEALGCSVEKQSSHQAACVLLWCPVCHCSVCWDSLCLLGLPVIWVSAALPCRHRRLMPHAAAAQPPFLSPPGARARADPERLARTGGRLCCQLC